MHNFTDFPADNADITQLQAANYHRLWSHLTLGPSNAGSEALRAEYCITGISHNTAILVEKGNIFI